MDNPMGMQNGGVSGRIIPSPGTRMRIDLYEGGIRLDTTFTTIDGGFSFQRQYNDRRYEIHVDVGGGLEYVEEVDFTPGVPTFIHIREQGMKRTDLSPDPNGKKSGTVISVASLNVPKDAAKEFQKGRDLGLKGKYDQAIQRLQKATEIYPRYAEAFNEIGLVYKRQNQGSEAEKAFEQAIHADPNWVSSYLNLGTLQLQTNQMDKLLDTSQRVLKLDSSLAPAYFFEAVAYYSKGNLPEAEKDALEANRNEHPTVPQIHLLLARIYQRKGDHENYGKQLKEYLKEDPAAPNADKLKQEIAQLKEK